MPWTPTARLANISTRGHVLTVDDVMIGGFIIRGDVPKRVILRARGPSLNLSGVPLSGRLMDPMLELHNGNGTAIATNDNWKVNDQTQLSQESQIKATTIPPSNDAESALVATLSPGNYTAVVQGKNGGTGVALVEVYNLR